MSGTLSRALLMLTAVAGCSVTASLGGDEEQETSGAAADGTSSVTSTSSGAVGGSGTTATTTGDLETSVGAGSTTFVGTASSDGSEAGATGSVPMVCQGPADQSCLSCLRDSCCSALEQCLSTPLCACLLGCLEFAPDFISCLDVPACGGSLPAAELQTCAIGDCAPACGL